MRESTPTNKESDRKLIGYFRKPRVVYTHLDEWYVEDARGYLLFLGTLRMGIRELLEGMLLDTTQENKQIQAFLINSSSGLAVLELNYIQSLLLSISETNNSIQKEELKSQLFYKLFFIIESINNEIERKNLDAPVLKYSHL
jgi:hypothetical protein